MAKTREEIFDGLRGLGFSDAVASVFRDLARPAVVYDLEPVDEAEVPIGASKLGGSADLPPDAAWPWRAAQAPASTWRRMLGPDPAARASPLSFVGQIDLAEAARLQPDLAPEHPRDGLLSLFYDCQLTPSGLGPGDDAVQVIWTPPGPLERRAPPIADFTPTRRFEPVAPGGRLIGTPLLTPPRPEDALEIDPAPALAQSYDRDVDDWSADEVIDWGTAQLGGDGRVVALAGWPEPAQTPMREEAHEAAGPSPADAAPQDWVLLLEIGHHERIWMFGDGGSLYVWIRRQDLAARNFHAAVLLWQGS